MYQAASSSTESPSTLTSTRARAKWQPAAVAAAEAAHRNVWSREDLRALHSSLVAAGVIPRTTTLSSLIAVLTENGKLREVELQPVNHSGGGDDTQHRIAKRRLIWGT